MSLKISELPVWARWSLLLVVGASSLAGLRQGTEAQRRARVFPPPLERPLPPGLTTFSLGSALGDEEKIAADIGYIDCLQYMGGANAGDGFWGKTLPLYREVQWLDPGFSHAILEGISALGWLYRRPAEAENLALAAYAANHREARYGVYVAALAYQKRLDAGAVLALLQPLAHQADAPAMLIRVVGNLLVQGRDWAKAWDYWIWVQSRSEDDQTLIMAKRTLKDIARHLADHSIAVTPTRPAP